MARMEGPAGRTDLRANLPSTRGSGSLLEVDAWIPSEARAISPVVERLMRLIEGSHCVAGEEDAVQLALREALNNAVVRGNRLDAHKLVHVRCRCKVGEGISLIVSHQGQGFDPSAVPDPLSADNLESEHGRGIHLMTLAMDEVSFGQRGTEVHMCKRLARNERAGVRIKQRPCRRFSVVTYALAAFRYLATGIVPLLLVLLIVELGAAIGAVPEQDIPTSGNRGGVIGASPEAKAFFGRAGVEVSLVHARADFGLATS